MPPATNEIPPFYHPKGRPKPSDLSAEKITMSNINTIIGDKTFDITNELSKKLLTDLLELPTCFSQLLLIRCTNNLKAEKCSKAEFLKVWKVLENEVPHFRAFWLLSSHPGKKYIVVDDFKVMFK
jgi:hypothetical protein